MTGTRAKDLGLLDGLLYRYRRGGRAGREAVGGVGWTVIWICMETWVVRRGGGETVACLEVGRGWGEVGQTADHCIGRGGGGMICRVEGGGVVGWDGRFSRMRVQERREEELEWQW